LTFLALDSLSLQLRSVIPICIISLTQQSIFTSEIPKV
jgi:hypothetical protein